MFASSPAAAPAFQRVTISAVLTRADGTVEDLGVIAASTPEALPRPSLLQRIGAKLCPRP